MIGLQQAQAWPAPAAALAYRLAIELPEFVNRFAKTYQRCAQEEADASFHQMDEVPALDRWQEQGYPPIQSLAERQPELLAELVGWFDVEALDALLPASRAESPQYIIDTVDRVSIDRGWLHLEGRANRSSLAQAS